MKNFIIILLVILCVFIYINRNADIDYGEKIRNFPQELKIFIENLLDPEKREILSKELSRHVRRVESKLSDIQIGTPEKTVEADEQYVSLALMNGLVAEGRLLRRTGMGDFVLQLPGSQVTIAKEEVKEIRYIEGEEAGVLKEVIEQAAAAEQETQPKTAREKLSATLGLVHRWESSIPSAIAKAKKENKLVMAEFSTTWCGWCKKLDKDTMKNSKVQSILNRYFVSVRIDGDKNKELVRQYKVRGYPNIVFMTNKGDVIMQQPGYLPPERFIELLYVIVQKFSQPALDQAAEGQEQQ
ncbi:MAG: thioredoxin family protein [Candidatus Omnitrophica bacterium]|nr:thioredoxin family protein [Candidatus Omnitrophota bacterium]